MRTWTVSAAVMGLAVALIAVDTPHLTWVAPVGRSESWLRSPAAPPCWDCAGRSNARPARGVSKLPRQAAAPLTAIEVLRKAVAVADADNVALEHYAWVEREIVREIGKDGTPGKVKEDKTEEISQVDGVEYDRMIARDGKPLSAKDQAKEDGKQAKFIREQDSPKKREERLRDQAQERKQKQELLEEIPEAFDIEMAPAEVAPLCDCYVLRGTPRAGYHGRDKNVDRLQHIAFTAWVDRTTFGLVRMRATILKAISIGWVFARIGKGGTLQFDTVAVDGHRFAGTVTANLSARLLLVKGFHLGLETTDSDYRKFGATTKILAAKPGGGG